MSPATLAYLLGGVLLNAIAQLALKAGTNRLGVLHFEATQALATAGRVALEPYVWLGLFCYVVSVGLWIMVLSRVDVSLAYPFLSLGYVVVTLAAWLLFAEPVTTQRLIAIGTIAIGVMLLYRT